MAKFTNKHEHEHGLSCMGFPAQNIKSGKIYLDVSHLRVSIEVLFADMASMIM